MLLLNYSFLSFISFLSFYFITLVILLFSHFIIIIFIARGRQQQGHSAEFEKKVLHCAWNHGSASSDTVAVGAQTALYLYKV